MQNLLLLANFASTWTMVGVIWIVQVVHYPLFNRVGEEGFSRYAEDHVRLITFIVGPAMLIEAFTSVFLLYYIGKNFPGWALWCGIVLLGVAWFTTLIFSVPQHHILTQGFDERAYRTLVTTNWLRTIAWTLRGALTAWLVYLNMRIE